MKAEQELVLVCRRCRWRPPEDLTVDLVAAHMDMDHDLDVPDIDLELVAWCHRCGLEMELERTEELRNGRARRHYSCGICRRSLSKVYWTPSPR